MKPIRWMALFDSHGDKVDPDALAVARTFRNLWRPTLRIHGGDIWDFRWLRRAAREDEKAETVATDFEAGLDLLGWYKPTHILWGNHDQRLRDLLDHPEGALRHLAAQWLDRIGTLTSAAQHFPYCKRRGVLRLADYSFLHGYCTGIGATRKHALVYGNCIFGHRHVNDHMTIEGLTPRRSYSTGSLCKLDLDYNRSHINTLSQEHGFAYGLILDDRLVVFQARKTGATWVLPTEVRTIPSS